MAGVCWTAAGRKGTPAVPARHSIGREGAVFDLQVDPLTGLRAGLQAGLQAGLRVDLRVVGARRVVAMPDGQGRQGSAVVIGAGIGGLVTAAVLARRFEEVVLVERDALPPDDAHRPGVGQAQHVHGLLARGAEHLENLFPGLRAELSDAGAPVFDHGAGARTQVWAGTLPGVTAGVEVQTVHRDVFEGAVRRRVLALPRVTVRDDTAVAGLEVDQGREAVTGVRLEPGTPEGEPETVPAELVVDASGRFSRLPDWLEAAGYARPAETRVDAGLAYATRVFKVTEPPARGIHGLQQMNQAPDRPGGVYAADIGNGRWIVTLFGAGGAHPPGRAGDEAEWMRFARDLENSHLDALLDKATPESGPHQYKRTENLRREYTRMRRMPDRLIALGDSYCAYNPVFGQGMTVAIREAVALGEALDKHAQLDGLARRIQRTVAGIARDPWLMSTSEDRVWAAFMRSERPGALLRATAWYKQRLLYLAVNERDPHIVKTFMRVYHMLASPAAMGSPRILAKVLLRASSPRPSRASG
ncbi:NAD(P)/FAD-dependent oxidoreductase [Streptomyces sp. NBC_01795]|uniref:NAD(P)/FAD-dependent oxidoreductase n=1 Tax=Streptomyces sp. NBC_01795 TaxID=2975943 RepID=UPI002DDB425C|nr:NAD(P)/FAD-dependent oxidoreductase [Streptomyces sp. NBC_01795]